MMGNIQRCYLPKNIKGGIAMLELATVKDMVKIENNALPLKESVKVVLEILDNNYGENRDIKLDLGGYVIVIEDEQDLEELNNIHIDVNTAIPEFVDIIGNKEYVNVLLILSSDYAISLFMPYSLTPTNFLENIDEGEIYDG